MGNGRDDRISELEAELATKIARIAEQDERIAEQDERIAEQDERIAEQDERISIQAEEISALKKQVAELLEKLNQDSSNSHKPPSTDPPGNRKQRRAKAKKKRKRGGQKGHKGSHRELLPPDQVDETINHYPPECENCWASLPQVPDPDAKRYQQTEIPPIRPHTIEHCRHGVTCSCGYKTWAAYDPNKIPASPFGPRLMALIAMLTGVYHLSRRKTKELLSDVLGMRISLGALSAVEARVSDAVEPAVNEAWDRVGRGNVKHTDGTSWYQAGVMLSLWTLATTAATVFKIVANGTKKTLRPLYGELQGILVSDRAKALNFWAMERRQICWSHLIRRYVSFSQRDGPAGTFGRELLDYTGVIFAYWHDYKAGKLSRAKFVAWMAPVREQTEALLARVVAVDIKDVSGSCADILSHKQALWTFIERDGVEPTNNHAERELRAFVLWRKRSFGTQSQRGNLFAERIMTVAHTARKQSKNVLAFLTACCQTRSESSTPSLFSAEIR